MVVKDGLGSVLEIHRNGNWVHIAATLRLTSMLMGYAVQFTLTYFGWKWWKGRKK